jgi:dihydrofolate reductase
MGKVVVSEFMSLDGVIEEPSWSLPYWNDAIAEFKSAETAATGSLLLGRVTYEGFAAVWPYRTDSEENPEWMNSIPKYVVSRSLHKVDWNNSTILREVNREAIQKILSEHDGNVLLYGSGTLVQSLLQYDLVDQINLLIYPLVLSKGKKLLYEQTPPSTFHLVESQVFAGGVVSLILTPKK